MRTNFLLVISTAVALILCSCSNIERNAKAALEDYLRGEKAELTNIDIKFTNDSLCIIHADLKCLDEEPPHDKDKIEYIYLISGGIPYEVCYSACSQGIVSAVYCTQESYDKEKHLKIYRELDYPEGLYHLATLKINSTGRVVGNPTTEVKIPSLTGTGNWALGTVLDDFGDPSPAGCLVIQDFGSATRTDYYGNTFDHLLISNLVVSIDWLNRPFPYFIFKEKDEPVAGLGNILFKIKDSKGTVHTFYLSNVPNAKTYTFETETNEEIIQILHEGGEIAVYATSNVASYSFRMDVSGYDKAMEILQHQLNVP